MANAKPRTDAPDEEKTAKKDAPVTEATAAYSVKNLTRSMKAKLDEQEKVLIKIPVDKMNPKDTTVLVQINGYTFTIKRGVEVRVPNVVKKLLERGGYI